MSLFPWAKFRKTKGAIKLHTLLDLRGNIPSLIYISEGKLHDVKALDVLPVENGALYVMDRAYVDFKRLNVISQQSGYFVIRAKSNLKFRRIYSHEVNRKTGLICDQTIRLTGYYQSRYYPEKMRRVKYRDPDTQNLYVFLTNNFSLSAFTIAELYRCRWQVELFFKWIKQNLRIKSFYGNTENAVKSQIWIAISVYVLVAIMKKDLNLEANLYTILQILSVNIFDRTPLFQAVTNLDYKSESDNKNKQLKLNDYLLGH